MGTNKRGKIKRPWWKRKSLCEVCRRLPLDHLFSNQSHGEYLDHKSYRYCYELGRLARISETSWCSFCRFIQTLWELLYPQHTQPWLWNLSKDEIFVVVHKSCVPYYFPLSGLGVYSIQNGFAREIVADLRFKRQNKVLNADHKIYVSRIRNESGSVPLSLTETISSAPGLELGLTPRQKSLAEATGGLLDFELLHTWLSICQQRHSFCSKSNDQNNGNWQFPFYLVDVQTRTVVLARPGTRYIALSYVWGKSEIHPHQRRDASDPSNSEMAVSERACPRTLPRTLPQTIEDSIHVVKKLNERYLWVDAYCIDQRDIDELWVQVENMDKVYSNAFLTIIAASGADASIGLPGISRPFSHASQPVVKIPFGTLMATFSKNLDRSLEAALWSRRAWTMQEGVLSTRSLTFTVEHVYLKCKEEVFIDILPSLSSRYIHKFTSTKSSDWIDRVVWLFSDYADIVMNYTKRKLSYSSDILNALAGILHRVSTNTKVKFLYGLPQQDIVNALVWRSYDGHALVRRHGFPSWSWCGWEGPVMYNNTNDASLGRGSHSLDARVTFGEDSDMSSQILCVGSSIAKFRLKVVNEEPMVADRESCWALYDADDHPVRSVVKRADHFASSQREPHWLFKTKYSSAPFMTRINEAELLLIRQSGGLTGSTVRHRSYAPSLESYGQVDALVIIRNDDRTANRVDLLTISCDDWKKAKPEPATIYLR
jgi:hypothetical protein